jgi:hypothetical protein
MSRRHIGLAAALVALVVLVFAPGPASAQGESLTISSAEYSVDTAGFNEINVTGNGVCGTAGRATITVRATDLETDAVASGFVLAQCTSPGEHLNWLVSAFNQIAAFQFRAGDRIFVTADSGGAINASDRKELILKDFH